MIRRLLQHLARRRHARREAKTRADSRTAIQVREFDGHLWLCHNNVPIVREDWSACPLTVLANEARAAWMQFQSQNRDYHP